MFPNTPRDVRRHANVKRASWLIGHDIDSRLYHDWSSGSLRRARDDIKWVSLSSEFIFNFVCSVANQTTEDTLARPSTVIARSVTDATRQSTLCRMEPAGPVLIAVDCFAALAMTLRGWRGSRQAALDCFALLAMTLRRWRGSRQAAGIRLKSRH